jgi:hypothetical protein
MDPLKVQLLTEVLKVTSVDFDRTFREAIKRALAHEFGLLTKDNASK